jgi:hypothetical protein
MIAPAGEFNAVVPHLFGKRREFGERQIGPLAGEEGNRSGHGRRRGAAQGFATVTGHSVSPPVRGPAREILVQGAGFRILPRRRTR